MKEKIKTKSVRIPEHIHRLLKIEAAESGETISDIIVSPFEALAEKVETPKQVAIKKRELAAALLAEADVLEGKAAQ